MSHGQAHGEKTINKNAVITLINSIFDSESSEEEKGQWILINNIKKENFIHTSVISW